MEINKTEYLNGGRESSIVKRANNVHRPLNYWTPTVHRFLDTLHNNGFESAPIPIGITESGQEIVSYIEGSVYNDILPENVKSDITLISVAKLIAKYHQASGAFLKELTGQEIWMLKPRYPFEVICHGDLAPYNTIILNSHASALIDFDTIHPGPRLWDIAYAIYRWAPIMAPENPESFGNSQDQLRRLELFLNEYDQLDTSRNHVLEAIIERLNYNIQFIKEKASGGDQTFQKHLEDGHHLSYLKDIEYIKELRKSNSTQQENINGKCK